MEVSLSDDIDSSSYEDISQSENESIENSSELVRKYSELSVEWDQLKKRVAELVVGNELKTKKLWALKKRNKELVADNEVKAKRINELDGYNTFYDDFGKMSL